MTIPQVVGVVRTRLAAAVLKSTLPIRRRNDLVRLGKLDSWVIPETVLRPGSICYSGGVGEDVSFDMDLIETYGCEVYAFDPTPRSIEFVNKQLSNVESFHFFPYGLWSSEKELRFYAPRNPSNVSHSALNIQGTTDYFVATCRPISTIIGELKHTQIDVLKLNIEGAEVEVLEDILRNAIRPQVISVTFDRPFPLHRTRRLIKRVLNHGYDIVAVRRFHYTLVRKS